MSNSECAMTDGVTPTRNVYSVPRDTVQTPAISRIGSTVHTPHLQRCHLESATASAEEDHGVLEHFVVDFEEEQVRLETCGLLGKGGFGKVFAVQSSSGNLYALKVSSKPMRDSDWRRLNEEITLMRHFSRHPNIVKLYFAGRDDKRAYVVMERCAGRSLHDLVAQRSLEVPEILWIGWALVNTVAYIHSRGCIHRDLKPQNLLFDMEGNLKITDFGLSSRISEAQPRKTVAGTAMYMAPEMAEEVYKRMMKRNTANSNNSNSNAAEDRAGPSLSYGKEVDTWSVGVVLYVLLTRMNPYIDAMERCGIRHVDKEQKSLVLFNAVAWAAWSWPRRWTGDLLLCRLVERMLHPDRNQRATLQEVQEDTIWHRRPFSCPLSLLQKLNLLDEDGPARPHAPEQQPQQHAAQTHKAERPANHPQRQSPTSHALQHLADNVAPAGGRRTVKQVMSEAVSKLESAEQRGRVRLWLACQETLTVWATLLALGRAETEERRRVVIDEAHTRAVHERTMRSTCQEILTRYSGSNNNHCCDSNRSNHDSCRSSCNSYDSQRLNNGGGKEQYSSRVAMSSPPTSPHDRGREFDATRAVSVSLLSQSATDEDEGHSDPSIRNARLARDASSHRRTRRSHCRSSGTHSKPHTRTHDTNTHVTRTTDITSTQPTTASHARAVVSPRSSSVSSTESTLVRSSGDRFAFVYPGRDVATRWSLRPVVSLPRELTSTIEQQLRCMNGHCMTRLTSMPHAYNGFDCNICDRGIEVITPKQPAFRCYKCDYDVCMSCGYAGRCKEVNVVCVSCGKKFVTSAKLQAHSLRCRGPSESPSPRRSSRMHTMLWESHESETSPQSEKYAIADTDVAKAVHSPAVVKSASVASRRASLSRKGHTAHARARHSNSRPREESTDRFLAGRPTYTRTSAGTHISVGDSHISSPEDVGALLVSQRPAEFLTLADGAFSSSSSSSSSMSTVRADERREKQDIHTHRATVRRRERWDGGADDAAVAESGSFSLHVPPPVTLPEHVERERVKPQPRSSAELRDFILRSAHTVDGSRGRRRLVGALHSPPSFADSSDEEQRRDGALAEKENVSRDTGGRRRLEGVQHAQVTAAESHTVTTAAATKKQTQTALLKGDDEAAECATSADDRQRSGGDVSRRGAAGGARRGRGYRPDLSPPTSPLQLNFRGEIIGIAARRRADSIDHVSARGGYNNASSGEQGAETVPSPRGHVGVIRIDADMPARPPEPFSQSPVPRSRSSSLARQRVKRPRAGAAGDEEGAPDSGNRYRASPHAYDPLLSHGREREPASSDADAALLAASHEATRGAAARAVPIAGPAAMQLRQDSQSLCPRRINNDHKDSNGSNDKRSNPSLYSKSNSNCHSGGDYNNYSVDRHAAHAAQPQIRCAPPAEPTGRVGSDGVSALQQLRPPLSRARSVSGMTPQGGPPLPRRGLAALSPPPLVHYSVHGSAALPPSSSSSSSAVSAAAAASAHGQAVSARVALAVVSPVHTTVPTRATRVPTRPPAPVHAAIPPSNFVPFTPSRQSMCNPLSIAYAHASMPGQHSARSATPTLNAAHASTSAGAPVPQPTKPTTVTPTLHHPLTNTGGAFLALPRNAAHKQQFLDDFLNGGWVRFYSFTNEDTVVMYYCLQPGRYGAMFPTEAGVGTAVLDIYSKLVMYVPCMNNESTSRSQPHPHVQTFYDEEARILTLTEAHRYLGDVLKCITAFVNETARLRSEGLTPAAVHAAFIHHRDTNAVPRDTKFVYIRKVFPDPGGTFTLFRLSNLRSQVVCNAMVDIRWQSDRRHNVGQKYYVHADGTAEPFVIDSTGILSQVEIVLNNSYRR